MSLFSAWSVSDFLVLCFSEPGKDLSNSTEPLVRQNLTRDNVIIPRKEFCMSAWSACSWDKLHQMSSGRTTCFPAPPARQTCHPCFWFPLTIFRVSIRVLFFHIPDLSSEVFLLKVALLVKKTSIVCPGQMCLLVPSSALIPVL